MNPALPFRIGTTSYIIKGNLAENAEFLATRVQDMELVLFDRTDGLSNFPDAAMQQQLSTIASRTGLTFTVHLPLDLTLRDGGNSKEQARQVISLTRDLPVYAVIVHLEGWVWENRQGQDIKPDLYQAWFKEARQLLTWLKSQIPSHWKICLENIENTPADQIPLLMDGLDLHLCIDVGHLLKVRYPDPMTFVQENLEHCRVIHLHGLDEDGRDHSSIEKLPADFVDDLLTVLLVNEYDEILTMEVFGASDFQTSKHAMLESCNRIGAKWEL